MSSPVMASQSLTTIPAPTTGDPRFTLPATRGTCRREESSSWSRIEVLGWTIPPWFERAMYEPVRTLSATVWRKTSTPRTSAMLRRKRYVSFLEEKKGRKFRMEWNGESRAFRVL